ncbi:hypothetical protein [Citricoccus sp.]|uniref:hypothetical protein n=1 Tax=Citricoccus sp. TaxID=1978372 RepID=UPI0028BE217F|nr:hypothetical protein [Citricoccus sp.]
MPLTATVTGRLADLSSRARPDWQPEAMVSLDRAAVTLDGTAVSTEPVFMDISADGTMSADLIVTAEFAAPVRYELVIEWLSPTGGTALRERLPAFVVPAGGGDLGDLALVETTWGLAWQAATPPPVSMLWLYIEPTYNPDSGAPLPTYTTPDGTTIEHGELVDWSA